MLSVDFKYLTNVCETIRGKTRDASELTFTGLASILILPHDIASSGLAPESLPSNSYDCKTSYGSCYNTNNAGITCPVFIKTE